MDVLNQATPLTLVLLALVDATSIGTLIIPIWLLLRRDYRRAVPRVLLYLGMIAVFYWCVGLLLRSGVRLGLNALPESVLDSPALRILAVILGAGMLAWSLMVRDPAKDEASAHAERRPGGNRTLKQDADHARQRGTFAGGQREGVLQQKVELPRRLRHRVDRALDSKLGLLILAVVAGVLELPTMLPYLGAMSALAHSGWADATQILALGGYCVVMVLPAVVLTLARQMLGAKLEAPLRRWGAKLSRMARESLPWIVGIAGFFLLRWALNGVDIGELLDRVGL
ncbi:GAP family protein [Glutamicibacter endophyticus]|uniref:GAP family protein n=1 Tax=Glutamicibacter endophyticus TaxID=1522174 RepID=UPI003AF1AAFB